MYLMNAPPVAAIHTKWRSCGPPRGFSLPLCFNDSDSDLSTTGTPIPDKVQMIIESLRSTQSSLNMGDEVEENVLAREEAHFQGGKLDKGTNPKCRDPIEAIVKMESETQDSDSDDSVDRGIEEAIQEYLKEKDDHKRKSELTTILSQPPKIPRTDSPLPENSNQNSCNDNVFFDNQDHNAEVQRSLITPAMKTQLKNSMALKEKSGTLKKSTLSDKVKVPPAIILEDNYSDSSSDDGIEEAIQRYQLEKKEEKHGDDREPCAALELKAQCDSSSDDGIEEAILCYQLQQKKEHSSVLAPSISNQKLISNASTHYQEMRSKDDLKKKRLSKKKKHKTDKEVNSPSTPPPFIKTKCINSPKVKGVNFANKESISKLSSSAPLKATTTADLMCAEAILDISKAVMPKMFRSPVSFRNSTLAKASTSYLGPPSCLDKSDDSSIDSEDGIEQEIQEFLEQKAQMHNQPSDPTTVTATCSGLVEDPAKTTVLRLSLTQKRRHKEQECLHVSKGEQVHKEGAALKPSLLELDRRKPSGDKSSSLDSDEDLDTAIKDLLKTKKLKKTRSTKLKARKGLADETPSLGKTLPGNKLRIYAGPPKEADTKRKNGSRERMKGVKSVPELKLGNKRKGSPYQTVEADFSKNSTTVETHLADNSSAIIQIKEESSSVDSDDGIELEIRKFLAEKAKGSASEQPRIGTANVCSLMPEDFRQGFKLENQLADIPVKSTLRFSDQLPRTGSIGKSSDGKVSQSTPSTPLTTSNVFFSNPQSSIFPVDTVDEAVDAKTERKRRSSLGNRERENESVRGQLLASPNTPLLDSERWHQSWEDPEASSESLSRSPLQRRSSQVGETSSTTPVRWRANANPEPAHISSYVYKNRRVDHFHSSSKTTTTGPQSLFPTSMSSIRPPIRKYFLQGQETACTWGQRPTPGHTESMLHVARDQNMFVELGPNMNNHVPIRSSKTSEGRGKRAQGEAKSGRESERAGVQDCVDETECESDERRSPEERQGFSNL